MCTARRFNAPDVHYDPTKRNFQQRTRLQPGFYLPSRQHMTSSCDIWISVTPTSTNQPCNTTPFLKNKLKVATDVMTMLAPQADCSITYGAGRRPGITTPSNYLPASRHMHTHSLTSTRASLAKPPRPALSSSKLLSTIFSSLPALPHSLMHFMHSWAKSTP